MDDTAAKTSGLAAIRELPSPLVHSFLAFVESYILVNHFPQYACDYTLRQLLWRIFLFHMTLQILWNVFLYPQFFSPLKTIPRPRDWITADGVLFTSPRGSDCLRWIKNTPNNGLIRTRAFNGDEFVLVTSPEVYAQILVHKTYEIVKPYYARKFLSRILGWGLISVEGDLHRAQRRSLMPAFQLKNIRDLFPLMWDKSMLLTNMLEKEIRANPIYPGKGEKTLLPTGNLEIGTWASRLTLDIIGPAAMGRDFQSLQNNDNMVANNYLELLQPRLRLLLYFTVALITPPWFSENLPTSSNAAIRRTMGAIRNVCLDIIREKKQALVTETEETQAKDILSTMLRGKELDDVVLVDQMLTFLAAGHETTANALSWVGWLLGKYPHYQTLLRDELRKAVVDPTQPITAAEIESLPMLNGICNEVIRLHPTVPITARTPTVDVVLAGQVVPKGCWMILSPYATNRDPKLWGDDAEVFRPERWIDVVEDPKQPGVKKQRLNSHGGSSTNYAMMTFLHGPRSCIGQGFAKAELRCAVAAMIGRFHIKLQKPNEELVSVGAVTPKPKGGVHLRMSVLSSWCAEP